MWLIIITILLLIYVFYLKVNTAYKYWEDKGVPYLKPWLFFGNISPLIFRKLSMSEFITYLYKSHIDKRYVGFYQFLEPMLLVNDIDLIKQITVKDFDAFPEHRVIAPENIDPLWDKNLFAMRGGEKWQDMRSTLSPSFTSNKLKIMFGLMHTCTKQVIDYLQGQCEKDSIAVVDMKDTFRRYGNDVISTTALGVTCDSFKDKENPFYLMGRRTTDFTGFRRFILYLSSLSPALMKLFKVSVFEKKARDFFRNVINQTVKLREENGVVRPDMIHLLMETRKDYAEDKNEDRIQSEKIKKTPRIKITNEDIASQALLFFSAGYESPSTFMSYLCYEVAINPEIQKRLFREIRDTSNKLQGEITYDALLGMKYLDMVVSETLRKWPISEFIDRLVVRKFTIEPKLPDEPPLYLDPNTNIWIPVFGIHRDPQHFPNPDKFDPERFNDENKKFIKPFTYLPFGAGPRNCIGSRFALLEAKLIVFEIIQKFEIVPVEKTQIPLVLSKGDLTLLTEKGIWLGFKIRKM